MVDRIERNKDLIQELVESTATHVGQIATIITSAVAGVAREIGEIVTDGFDMREAAQRAKADQARHVIEADLVDELVDAEPAAHEPTSLDEIEQADDVDGDVVNLDASIEAPVVPQELDANTSDSGEPIPDTQDTTLGAMMEAPIAPDEK